MITNNKYIRGNIGEFDKQVISNIKIEDYEKNKANKYLVTKEYLNKYLNNINNINYIFPIIIRDEDITNIVEDTEEEKIHTLFTDYENIYYGYFDECLLNYTTTNSGTLTGFFIRQKKEEIIENNKHYYIFKNYFKEIELSFIDSHLDIELLNYYKQIDLFSGRIYNTLTYSYTNNNENDEYYYKSIKIQSFLCIDKNSILPIIPLSFSFPIKYIYKYINNNDSFIKLNYQNNIINYIGYNYNDYVYVENKENPITKYDFIFESQTNININKISKNIDTTQTYDFNIFPINQEPSENTFLQDIYFTNINLNILSIINTNIQDNLIFNFDKILTSDYINIITTNYYFYNLFPIYNNTSNNTKITLTSFSGKLKNEANTKIVYSKKYNNIIYYSFEYDNNIYNYTINENEGVIKLSLLNNNYEEYNPKIFFPQYDNIEGHIIQEKNNIFLCTNNTNFILDYYGTYSNTNTTFISIYDNNILYYLIKYFENDLFLNLICGIFEDDYEKLKLRIKIINPSLSKYLIYDWIPLYDFNIYNEIKFYNTNYLNNLKYNITYKAYIKKYESSS